jgi:hypothetical protein
MALHYGDSKDIILLGPRTSESLEHTFLACIRLFVTLPLLHLSAMTIHCGVRNDISLLRFRRSEPLEHTCLA